MSPSLQGILWMCAGVFCLSVGDAISKWLGEVHSPIQIIFFRTLISVPLIALIAHFNGGLRKLTTRRPRVHLVRGLIATGTMLCFVFGLTLLPLAETTAIAFAAPLFVTLLSVPLLGEKVERLPLVAAIVGFVGVLIVVRPGAAGFQPGAFIVVGAAVFYALLMITARRYGLREYLWAMVFYVTLVPLVITAVLLPWVWQMPWPMHWLGFIGAGIFGVGAMACITMAFRYAPAALAAPFDYTAMVWAVLLGWWFWDEVPDLWVYVGTLVIIISGLAIAYHERRTTLKRRPTS
ncbi:S-adenosylmethionine uptake transporter [Litchfieldella anticariensis FP35 = DSM 16096]|uniref:S-adenosylmethionine uptake transporter n=1 Tax=Litchfieldella anticariensis (strain DSM 16096 / CECT 5854 / CIP 108499 / LMG 22089 / FP35) TaxID=1121939 RepID=S2KEQ2_LITA3|nr:DMT family transporter [Halomonas anticariensis]EPC00340.1 S-adenosylmethionine uptake transporter [Halomonas anticariensis FP35 = DSM 16096]